jgi:hypothetical protein
MNTRMPTSLQDNVMLFSHYKERNFATQMAHACSSSYSGGGDGRIVIWG